MRLPGPHGLFLLLFLAAPEALPHSSNRNNGGPLQARLPAESLDRGQEALAAETAFLQTHLFTDGRGMHLAPGLFTFYELLQRPEIPVDSTGWILRILGFNLEDRRAIGLFGVDYRGARVGVLGCVGCHSGQAAGRTIVGLGNKRIDVGLVGQVAMAISRPCDWTRRLRAEHEQRLIERVMAFTSFLQDPARTNVTQGMVPVSIVQHWFYAQAGKQMGPEMPRPGVKVPHLWGYGEKRKIGLFCDGFGDGSAPGWAAMVELAAGQTTEAVRTYRHRLDEVEALFEKFLPPAYPFAIDRSRARQGGEVFARACCGCHGRYRKDALGFPIFEAPRHIPWEIVRTDTQRLRAMTTEFRRLVAASPLSDLIQATTLPPGYFAPRLEGVWARFPYLHNASVPSIRALLTRPPRRPTVWSLRDAGALYRFDPIGVGLTVPNPGSREELQRQAERGCRDVYSVRRLGHSNQGHWFGTDLSEEDKVALIEYLKTL